MRAILLTLLMCTMAFAAKAQDTTAALVADQVSVSGDVLSATGNVEISHSGVTLRAGSVTYDRSTDQLRVTGPIYILEEDGTAIAADVAQLSGDLQTGLLQSARLVFAEQLQIAAAEIKRVDERYTQFYKTVASSCKICADDPTPLWEIRAKTITHDADERQLYFDNASLHVLGIPVFYTPYLRLPDPSVERASGFLLPELRSNGDLGIGLRVPYFFVLNDHADLTLTPWFTTKGSKTLETRYRQKFVRGEIEINSAITNDNLTDDELRGYLFADGSFALPAGFTGTFDVEATSDPGYLLIYDYSDKDRLDSAVRIERASRDELIWAELIHYRSLRSEESNRTTPTIVGDAAYTRRFVPNQIGGIATVSVETSGHIRTSSFDATDSGLARDVARLSAVGNWRKDWVTTRGMIFAAEAEMRLDRYRVEQDRRLQFGNTAELSSFGLLEWRWPMLKQSGRVSHLIEPVAQVVWTNDNSRDVVNEDSLLVEADETNLFEFSHFPGVDATERGRRVNLGVSYTRTDPRGWDLALTVGRIIRDRDLNQFSNSTGLQSKSSDWLIAAQLSIGEHFDVINRAIIDDGLTVARNETRLQWNTEKVSLGSTFVWLEADTFEGRPLDTSEFSFDGALRVSRHWTLLSDLRYDFVDDRTTEAGLGLRYQNECARVDLSVSRRFTSSTNVTPTTDFSLSVQLAGFGARNTGGASFTRQCN